MIEVEAVVDNGDANAALHIRATGHLPCLRHPHAFETPLLLCKRVVHDVGDMGWGCCDRGFGRGGGGGCGVLRGFFRDGVLRTRGVLRAFVVVTAIGVGCGIGRGVLRAFGIITAIDVGCCILGCGIITAIGVGRGVGRGVGCCPRFGLIVGSVDVRKLALGIVGGWDVVGWGVAGVGVAGVGVAGGVRIAGSGAAVGSGIAVRRGVTCGLISPGTLAIAVGRGISTSIDVLAFLGLMRLNLDLTPVRTVGPNRFLDLAGLCSPTVGLAEQASVYLLRIEPTEMAGVYPPTVGLPEQAGVYLLHARIVKLTQA